MKLSLEYLPCAIKAYKEAVQKNSAHNKAAKADTVNKSVKKLFKQVKNNSAIMSDLFGAE